MFHTRLNNFPVFRNYRDIDLRCTMYCIALYGRSSNKCSNLNELKFEDFQAIFLILLA